MLKKKSLQYYSSQFKNSKKGVVTSTTISNGEPNFQCMTTQHHLMNFTLSNSGCEVCSNNSPIAQSSSFFPHHQWHSLCSVELSLLSPHQHSSQMEWTKQVHTVLKYFYYKNHKYHKKTSDTLQNCWENLHLELLLGSHCSSMTSAHRLLQSQLVCEPAAQLQFPLSSCSTAQLFYLVVEL